VELYGHRGARGEAPENTIAGCRHAVAAGIRRLEIDLRLSADHRWVVFHDETLERIVGRAGRVGDFDAAELAAMDASGGRQGAFAPGTVGVPTLDALLEATPEVEHWQLEIKPTGPDGLDDALVELREVVGRHGDPPRYALTSLSPDVLAAAREAVPAFERGLVATADGQLDTARALGCRYLCLAEPLADRGAVAIARAAGFHVSVWTVNDAATLHRLRSWRAHSAITDLPTLALAALARP
jgi:glycerophosphoryl diester phosphodiesterase